MTPKPIPYSTAELNSMFNYIDGKLYWKVSLSPRVAIGDHAGFDTSGYLVVKVKGRRYLVHRLIYKILKGTEPCMIDHINMNRLDNRIENLRECDNTTNQQNVTANKSNKTGVKGLSVRQPVLGRQKLPMYYAQYKVYGIHTAKQFPYTEEGRQQAINWLETERAKYHKEFANG